MNAQPSSIYPLNLVTLAKEHLPLTFHIPAQTFTTLFFGYYVRKSWYINVRSLKPN